MMAHEERLVADATDDVANLSPQALREVLQNLRLHQIELQMQNDELRRIQAALNTADARYFDFYDLAPVGYVTVSDQALILQANLTTASLLGVPRAELIGKALPSFMSAFDADRYYLFCKQVLVRASEQPCELQMRQASGNLVWVKLEAIAVPGDAGAAVIRMVLSDISERKQADAQSLANNKFRDAILDSVPSQIAVLDQTGCIVAVNQRWRDFALDNSPTPGQPTSHTDVGTNYLAICQATTDHPTNGSDADGSAALARDGILGVMNGSAPSFQLEYPCHSPTQQRRFSLAVTPLNLDNHAVVVTHTDITHRWQLEQAIKQASEDKFRLVADNTSDGILIVGADRQVQYVSSAYLMQLGYSQAEELGRTPERVFSTIHPQERDAVVQGIERAIESKASELLYSFRARHRLGHYILRENNARFQYDEFGNFAGVCIVARDITERRRAEQELQASDLRYQWLVEEIPVGAVMHGPSCEILRSNAKALELLGLTEDQLLGKTSFDPQWDVIHEDGSPFPGSAHPAPQAIATRQPVRNVVMGVFRPTTRDRVWLLVNAHPQLNPDSSLQQVVVTFGDITEAINSKAALHEMNLELGQSRQQLRQLVAINETTLEKEKRHIAREVHDELGQVLTALRMDLSLALIRHASQVPDLNDALSGMQIRVDHAVQCVRNVANSLRPAVLDMGLETAIEWLSREFNKHGTAACELHGIGEGFEIDDSRAVVIFRIVQEALTNITKYASASQVDITLERCEGDLRLEIRDNGHGFDLVAVAQRGTLGLLGMRERVIALDGRIEVSSAPGRGTTISIVIPLKPEVAKDSA